MMDMIKKVKLPTAKKSPNSKKTPKPFCQRLRSAFESIEKAARRMFRKKKTGKKETEESGKPMIEDTAALVPNGEEVKDTVAKEEEDKKEMDEDQESDEKDGQTEEDMERQEILELMESQRMQIMAEVFDMMDLGSSDESDESDGD